MSRILLCLLLCLPLSALAGKPTPAQSGSDKAVVATPVSAQQKALAERYFKAAGIDRMYADSEQLTALINSQLAGMESSLPPAKRADFRTVMEKIKPDMNASIARALAAMRPQLVEVVTRSYSEQELTALVKFYESPEGKSVVAKNPQVMAAMMEVAGQQMAPMMQDIQQSLMRALKEQAAADKTSPAGE